MELVLEKVTSGPSLAKGEVQAATPTPSYKLEANYNQNNGVSAGGSSHC